MSGLSYVYPAPPVYYKAFTNENVQEFKQIDDKDRHRLKSPLDLMVPPEPQSTYRSFGSLWNEQEKLPSLTDVGIKQLYNDLGTNKDVQSSHQDRVWELKKLLKSLLINFLQLVDIMSKNPEQFPGKVDDIRVILINMHHLLNEYRPHQSRESLILMIEDQIEKKKQEIEWIKSESDRVRQRIEKVAKEFLTVLPEDTKEDRKKNDQLEEDERERDLRLWKAIE